MSEETIKYETTGEPFIANLDRGMMHTVTAFSGCDLVIRVNDKVVGEVSGIKFTEQFKKKYDANGNVISDVTITGYLEVTFFNSEPTLRKIIREEGVKSFVIGYADEFGNWCKATFVNPEFTERFHNGGVDSIVFEERYLFSADDITYDAGRKSL